MYDFSIIFSSACRCACLFFERHLSPPYVHVQNNNDRKFTGAYSQLHFNEKGYVREVLTLYSVLMAPIFPLELSWASLNCSQNTSFLFRPLTVISIKRHSSEGFEMATLISEHGAVEVGQHPLTPLCYLTYEFNNLSFAPCLKDMAM